jgi:hypothetical protein
MGWWQSADRRPSELRSKLRRNARIARAATCRQTAPALAETCSSCSGTAGNARATASRRIPGERRASAHDGGAYVAARCSAVLCRMKERSGYVRMTSALGDALDDRPVLRWNAPLTPVQRGVAAQADFLSQPGRPTEQRDYVRVRHRAQYAHSACAVQAYSECDFEIIPADNA